MTNQSRVQPGVPAGGQFAARAHAEVDIALIDTGSQTHASQRAAARLAGLRHQRSLAADAESEKLRALAASVKPATVLVQSADGHTETIEGRLSVRSDGTVEITRKMSKFAPVPLTSPGAPQSTQVLDIAPGYGHSKALNSAFDDTVARCPQVVTPTFDDLPVASEMGEPPSEVSAVYVLDHPGFDEDQDGRGVVFFATDHDPEYGVVNGYMVCHAGSGMYSEHGSVYERDLKNRGGRVAGYRPGSLTFSDAVDMAVSASASGGNDIEACWDRIVEASR